MKYALFLFIFLASCTNTSINNKIVAEIECTDGAVLKFEKTLRSQRNNLEGAHFDFHNTLLWYCPTNDKCTLVDTQNKPTPDYEKILFNDSHLYEYLNTEKIFKIVTSGHFSKYIVRNEELNEQFKLSDKSWDIFINPKVFSKQKYEIIKTAIIKNLNEINSKLVNDKFFLPTKKFSYAEEPFLNSIVYFEYNVTDKVRGNNYLYSKKNIEVRLQCENKNFSIILSPSNNIYLVDRELESSLPARDAYRRARTLIGNIYKHTDTAKLRIPFPRIQEKYNIRNIDLWFKEYSNCYDSNKKSLFDYYKIGYWNYKHKDT